MFLFIFESIGTAELIMIGIVALIFLGPRKLPEIARKMGKIMADFRSTTNDFKQTWEREVNFEEEAKAIRSLGEDTTPSTVPASIHTAGISAPVIKEIDPGSFPEATAVGDISSGLVQDEEAKSAEAEDSAADASLSDKKNWL